MEKIKRKMDEGEWKILSWMVVVISKVNKWVSSFTHFSFPLHPWLHMCTFNTCVDVSSQWMLGLGWKIISHCTWLNYYLAQHQHNWHLKYIPNSPLLINNMGTIKCHTPFSTQEHIVPITFHSWSTIWP
jgi:hypothetical protein